LSTTIAHKKVNKNNLLNNQIVSDNFVIARMPKFSATAVAAAVAGTKHAATGAPLKSLGPSKIAKGSVDALKYAAGGYDSGATILSIYPAREGRVLSTSQYIQAGDEEVFTSCLSTLNKFQDYQMSSNSLFLRMDLAIGFSGEFTFES
jgi:hypothetical protein